MKTNVHSISYLIFLLCLLNSCISNSSKKKSNVINETNVSGRVIGIMDGDTYELLLNDKKTVRVRMAGIDAPEKGMPFYKKSKLYLSDLCFGKQLRLEVLKIDRYGRFIAFSYLDSTLELSHEMIKSGMAWHFKEYNNDQDLADLENQAREARVGLWIDSLPMAPWENRKLHRKGISTKDSFR